MNRCGASLSLAGAVLRKSLFKTPNSGGEFSRWCDKSSVSLGLVSNEALSLRSQTARARLRAFKKLFVIGIVTRYVVEQITKLLFDDNMFT